jgi:phospholipid N-methyltransferase
MIQTIQEKLLLLYKFARAPKQIGSVTPSSSFLAKQMVNQVDWNEVSGFAELGAGTGAITKYIAGAKKSHSRGLLFEKDPMLRGQLNVQYADMPCYSDASSIRQAMQKEQIEELDCIFSGLPFFNFPQELRDTIINEVYYSLKPGGLFIAFQYSQQMKKLLGEHFTIEKIEFVPLNIPPAFVYVCRKREVQ